MDETIGYPTLGQYRESEPDEIIVECSNKMEYLRQYFFIREYIYTRDLHLKSFSGQEDEIDQYSHFIIARKGSFCIGGARLTVSPAHAPKRLPLEDEQFSVRELYPQLASMDYCELGRTALLPQYRSGENLMEIFKLSAQVAKENGCKLLFGASPKAVSRRFKAAFNQMGYPTIIHDTVRPPMQAVHEGLGLYFMVLNLCPDEINVDDYNW
jgi:hypothetical protein